MSNFICVIKHTVICRQATMGQKKEAAGDWNSSGVKLDSLDIVRDTTAAIRKRRKYLQAQLRVNEGTEYCLTPVTAKLSVTLSAAIKPHSLPLWRLRIINNAFTTAVHALLMIRRRLQGRERGWTAAENATDSFCATLLLLGLEGKGTFTHANWSEGWNIAFAFDELPCIDSESPVSRLTVSCPHAHYLTAVDSSHALVCQYALSWLYIRGKFMPRSKMTPWVQLLYSRMLSSACTQSSRSEVPSHMITSPLFNSMGLHLRSWITRADHFVCLLSMHVDICALILFLFHIVSPSGDELRSIVYAFILVSPDRSNTFKWIMFLRMPIASLVGLQGHRLNL